MDISLTPGRLLAPSRFLRRARPALADNACASGSKRAGLLPRLATNQPRHAPAAELWNLGYLAPGRESARPRETHWASRGHKKSSQRPGFGRRAGARGFKSRLDLCAQQSGGHTDQKMGGNKNARAKTRNAARERSKTGAKERLSSVEKCPARQLISADFLRVISGGRRLFMHITPA